MTASKEKATPDRVDRAIVAVERAVDRLVALLGDDDPGVMERAALALAEIGPFAVGPLAAALPKAALSRHGVVIIGALLTFGQQAKVPVMGALIGVLERDPPPDVKAAALAALNSLLVDDMGQVLSSIPRMPATTPKARG